MLYTNDYNQNNLSLSTFLSSPTPRPAQMTDEELMEMITFATKNRPKDKKVKEGSRDAVTEDEFMRLLKKTNLY